MASAVACAAGVAVCWSLTLLLVFPAMKVLLHRVPLGTWLDGELARASAELAERPAGVLAWPGHAKLEVLRWARASIVPLVPDSRFDALLVLVGLLLAVILGKGVARFLHETLVAGIVNRTIMDLRKACFRRVLKLDYQTVARVGTADVMSRMTHDVGILAEMLYVMGVKLVREPLKILACLACALLVNWRLTVLALLLLPPAVLVFRLQGRALKRASHSAMESMARIYRVLEETVASLRVVIAFGGAPRHRRQFHREHKQHFARSMTIARINALASPGVELIIVLAICGATLPGAYLVLAQTGSIVGIPLAPRAMDATSLILMYTLLAGTIEPARKLSAVYAVIRRGYTAAERLFDLLHREPLVRQPRRPWPLARHAESIEFQDVSFRFAPASDDQPRPAALDRIHLTIRFGEVVAIVGENGSGKSTLVNLLPRYYAPREGTIRIDGVDLSQVSLRDLRAQIGIVPQETLLFDDTIFENIRYGKRSALSDEVRRAAEQAGVLEFIGDLPDGFETVVGPGGSRMSGGQRQRIALARAILRDPAILILDEATSAVDVRSELQLHQALKSFVRGRTTLLITHDLGPALLEVVTRVVVLDRGRLVADGPHEQLLATCPLYGRLFGPPGGERLCA
jgi:ATP-binding cassette, subfamily B, bacterial MsbA